MEFDESKNGLPDGDPMGELGDAIGDLSRKKTRGKRIAAALIPIYDDGNAQIFTDARESMTGTIISLTDIDLAPGTRNDSGVLLREDRLCASLVQVGVVWYLSVTVERDHDVYGVCTPIKTIIHPLWHAINHERCRSGSVRYLDDAGPRDHQNKSAAELLDEVSHDLRAASVRSSDGANTSVSDPPTPAERVLATQLVGLVRDVDAVFDKIARAKTLIEQPPITDVERDSQPGNP